MCEIFDLVVIGGGPGGYKCAIRAAQLGMKVACIDANDIFGGTCLREGCIPSKCLLNTSHLFYSSKNDFGKFGLKVGSLDFDLSSVMSYKQARVQELGKGIEYLFNLNGVKGIKGFAKISSFDQDVFSISISGSSVVKAKKIVLATGSNVASLPSISIDEERIISSSSSLNLDKVPSTLAVIGAGAIGLEMSSIWSRFGSKVTVIEFADRIAPSLDKDLSQALLLLMKRQGIDFMLATKVLGAEESGLGVSLKVKSLDEEKTLSADKVLVSVGRKPCADSVLDDFKAKLDLDNRGFVKINNEYETNIPGLFAIGDVVGGAMLAHKAEEEGIAVAKIISGGKPHVDYNLIPSIIYTHPAVASIGKTEQQLHDMGYDYKIGKSSFVANSRSKVVGETDGFVKILACKKKDTILGVHIIGAFADVLINEAAVAMTYGASTEDVFRICHSHPDVNEAFRDAAYNAFLNS